MRIRVGIVIVAMVTLAGCVSVAPAGSPSTAGTEASGLRFRVVYSWDVPVGNELIPPELSMQGTSTLEGSIPESLLRDGQPSEATQATVDWSHETEQFVDYYQQGTCQEGDLAECDICTATYVHPARDLVVDLRVESRDMATATVHAWVYNDPSPADEELNVTDCQSMPGVNSPWGGFGPMLIETSDDGSGVFLEVEPAPDSMTGEVYDPYGSWRIERLP